MPFDSNGTFNRLRSWASDAAAGIKIRSDYHDQHDGDLANGLSNCITKDGRSQPVANIPLNQKKIVNLGEPTSDSDAATKKYVDNFKTFATGLTITGANYPNGMLHFSASTGITGLSWVNADMSWVGKTAETGKWRQRLAVTNDAQGKGSELVSIDKGGYVGILSGRILQNLSHDGTDWRVDKTGTGSSFLYANGTLTLASNDTATLQDNQVTTLQNFWVLGQTSMTHASNGNTTWSMQKKASGNTNTIRGYTGTSLRWNLELGNTLAETGTGYVGSNYVLTAYDNAGANGKTAMQIVRDTLLTYMYGDVNLVTGHIYSNTTTMIVGAKSGGAIYLRPNGIASTVEQAYVATDGAFHINGHLIVDLNTTRGSYLGMGQHGRNGTGGSYSGYWHNWLWSTSGTDKLFALVNNTNVGAITFQCDYRIKRNIAPLPSTWTAVKRLRPITYQPKAYGELFHDSDEWQWGFLAHELQDDLLPSAATGRKDEENVIQSPNLVAIIAGLTKALQEAMERIEALEAAV